MILYGIFAMAALVAVLLAVIVSQWSYQRSLRASIVAMHKRVSSAEMALVSLQRIHADLKKLDGVQYAQNKQASSAEHLAKRADFDHDWLSTGGDRVSTDATGAGADAADFAQN